MPYVRPGRLPRPSWIGPLGLAAGLALAVLGGCAAPGGPAQAPAAPSIAGFSAARDCITAGTGTTLTATFQNGTGTVDPGVGTVLSGQAFPVAPSGDTTYTLTVKGPGGSATRTEALRVVAAPAIASFKAADPRVPAGTGTQLTATFSGGDGAVDGGIGAVASGIPVPTGALGQPATFRLTVTNAAGTAATATVTVDVYADVPSITTFSAARDTVTQGGGTTLTAVFTGGLATLSPGLGAVASGVPVPTGPLDAGTTYTLTVTSPAGIAVSRTTTVAAVPPPVITSFTPESGQLALNAAAGTRLTALFRDGKGSVDQGVGPVASGVPAPTGPVRASTRYTLTVTNPAGDSVTAATPVYGPNLIATAEVHALAVDGQGRVWAWGRNDAGELGDGTLMDRPLPVPVPGLPPVVSVSAGGCRSNALAADGTVWAWGAGELGDGSGGPSATPVQVPGLSGIVAVSTGMYHSLALKSDGTVWAWGFNPDGRIGDGSTVDRATPVQVPGLPNIVTLSAGGQDSLAIDQDGACWRWGHGDGGEADLKVPTRVAGLPRAVLASTGYGTDLVLLSDGSVWTRTPAPSPIPGLRDITGLARSDHGLALGADGTLWAWGDNRSGQCGVSPAASPFCPVTQVPGLPEILSVASGSDHSLALARDGSLLIWGDNHGGLLGDGAPLRRLTPAASPLKAPLEVSAGDGHAVARMPDGTLQAWGWNINGDLGTSDEVDRSLPATVPGLDGLLGVSANNLFTYFLAPDGHLSLDGPTSQPLLVDPGAVSVLDGDGCVFLLHGDGTLWAFGDNAFGQLGVGTTDSSDVPVEVLDLTNVKAVAASGGRSFALKRDGTVWAWGLNTLGALGDGTTQQQNRPVQVPSLTNITSLAAGGSATVALRSDGTVWFWGLTGFHSGEVVLPAPVAGISNAVAIALNYGHCLVLEADGTVWAWGENESGQLGDGTRNAAAAPVQVQGLSGVTAIWTGWGTSYAATPEGVVVWGDDSLGGLGLGRLLFSSTAIALPALRLF